MSFLDSSMAVIGEPLRTSEVTIAQLFQPSNDKFTKCATTSERKRIYPKVGSTHIELDLSEDKREVWSDLASNGDLPLGPANLKMRPSDPADLIETNPCMKVEAPVFLA